MCKGKKWIAFNNYLMVSIVITITQIISCIWWFFIWHGSVPREVIWRQQTDDECDPVEKAILSIRTELQYEEKDDSHLRNEKKERLNTLKFHGCSLPIIFWRILTKTLA